MPRTSAGRDHRRSIQAAALAAALVLSSLGPVLAASEGDVATTAADDLNNDGPVYSVDGIAVRYATAHPSLPSLGELLPVAVPLSRGPLGLVPLQSGLPPETISLGVHYDPPLALHASAVGAVAEALVAALREAGVVGVYVSPSEADIDLSNEDDLRPGGRGPLRLVISVGRVRELRSVAIGPRIDPEWAVNNPAHRHLRELSPVQPSAARREGQTDILLKKDLEEYLFRLNRHPGRNVAAALAPAADGDGIALDLRVSEAKPWTIYSQWSDTGTASTDKWQHRTGFIHRQLTSRDDVLSLEWTNAGGNSLNALSGSYEARWFPRKRPGWWKTSGHESPWLAWIDRDSLPWWGVDNWRWRVNGSWTRFEADALDLPFSAQIRGEDWSLGWALVVPLFQHRAWFVDFVAGTNLREIRVRNSGSGGSGEVLLFLPRVGIELAHSTELAHIGGSLLFEANVGHVERGNLDRLGRRELDGNFELLHYEIGGSHFLEPLLNPAGWRDPATHLSSTLAHEIAWSLRGQLAFGNRLPPQTSQVVGGLHSVRGYPQSAASGDSVAIASFEYRFHVPRSLPVQREPFELPGLGAFRAAPQQVYGRPDWDLILRAFVDVGRTLRSDRFLGPADSFDDEAHQTLIGAGVGAELRLRSNLTVRMDWARALKATSDTNDPVDSGDDQFHLLFNVLY